jgi:peptidoglycan-associated lipoprotein
MNRIFRIVVLAALAMPAGACASRSTPPPEPPPAALSQPSTRAVDPSVAPSPEKAPAAVEVDDGAAPYNMYVVDSIRLLCGGPEPLFAFDVSKTLPSDQPTMKHLLECLTVGALHGRSIKLIGHADPRGTAEYNERLGLHRANKVKAFLVANGVDASRVLTLSAGAQDAVKAPKEWAWDRRVQIVLLP